MRSFQNIAKLIRAKRVSHTKGYSQSELSNLLGYKNGQFISNVERGLCNIPLKMLRRVVDVLDIPAEDLKLAILKDEESNLNRYLYGSAKAAANKKTARKGSASSSKAKGENLVGRDEDDEESAMDVRLESRSSSL